MRKDLEKRFKFGQKSTITLNPSIQEDEKRINILKDKGFRGKENDEKDQYRNSDLIKASEFNYLFTNIRDEFENIYQNLKTIYDNVSIADGSEKLTLGINNSGLVSLRFINTFTSFWNILPVMNGLEDYLGFTWSSESNISNEKLSKNEDRKYWKFIFTKDGELYSNGKNENRRFILKYELDNVEKKLDKKIGENGSQITEIWKKINNEIDKSIENIKNEVKKNTTKSKENETNISTNTNNISNIDNKIVQSNIQIDNLKNDLNKVELNLNKKIDTNESDITKIQKRIEKVNENIENINNEAKNKFILKNELDDVRLGLNQKIGTNESKIAILWDKVYNEIYKNIDTILKVVDQNDTRNKKNETNISINTNDISNNDSRIRQLNTRTNNLETTSRNHEEKMKYFENKFSMTTFEQFLIEKWKFITNHSWVSVENIDWNHLYNWLDTPGIYRDQNNSRNILLVYKTSWEMYWKDRYYSSDDYIIGKDMLYYNYMIVLSKLPMMNKLLGIRSNSVLDVLYCEEKEKGKKLVDVLNHINDDQIDSSSLMYFYLKEKEIYYIASHHRCYIYDSGWKRVRDYTSNNSLLKDFVMSRKGDGNFKLLDKYKADNFSRIWLLFKYGYYIERWGSDSSSIVNTNSSFTSNSSSGGTIRSVDEAEWIEYKYIEKWEDRSKYLQEVIDEVSSY